MDKETLSCLGIKWSSFIPKGGTLTQVHHLALEGAVDGLRGRGCKSLVLFLGYHL